MPDTSPRQTNPWIAFAAGAVAMLVVVLLWSAWSRGRDTLGALRAEMALSPRPTLPSIPLTPPEGRRMPALPLPGPS